jgi:hypothetical protein
MEKPMNQTPLCALAIILALTLPAHAGEIETTRFDITSAPLSIFGLQYTADYLGPPAGCLLETRAVLTFTTDESFDAADITLFFQAPSEGVPGWTITGDSLGWSGAGRFTASLSTDTLNGLIDLGDPPPTFSLFFLQITSADGGALGGQFIESYFEVDVHPPVDGDLDGDCAVGFSDLLALLSAWGPCPDPRHCPADLDDDDIVGFGDLLVLLTNWG